MNLQHSFDALRWLLNHAEEKPRRQVGPLMQCFQMPDGTQRWPVKLLLEMLWEQRNSFPQWQPSAELFDANGKMLGGMRGLILWDSKNKRSRHGTQLDVFGNPARFTHYMELAALGVPE